MLARLAEFLWFKGKFFAVFLLPLSLLFFLMAKVNKLKQIKQAKPFAVPVVVVGNINVGGTGKTPLVIAIVSYLKSQGLTAGVVSRGYGGSTSYPYILDETTTADISGDEPLLIFQQCQCPVVVSPRRSEAIQCLLDQHSVDVVISDDGMQHYSMHRDIEIAVLDGRRGLGNGFCLPAGPLRELASRLESVDFIVSNSQIVEGISLPQVKMQLKPAALQALPYTTAEQPKPRDEVYAVAGIGNPERFFTTLKHLQYSVINKPFADHHNFCENELIFADDKAVIMTSKDAVKCAGFKRLNNHWQLPVTAELAAEFLPDLLMLIQQKIEEN